jgi:hypothetical protein
VFVECVDQLAKRRSNFHEEDRISVEYVEQLAQRRSDFTYHRRCAWGAGTQRIWR